MNLGNAKHRHTLKYFLNIFYDISYFVFALNTVIDDKTCEERLWRMKRQGETNFYFCEINRDMVIHATFEGNQSRYINHSCSPNTEMQNFNINFSQL